ncbi:MAG: YigZ family protein [Clostridia bacterium]|nr:YigZ family protein [Clostridia bacterium]
MNEYLTIGKRSKTEFVEKRSRFIGSAFPVNNREEAERIVSELKSEYWDAKHNVFAYILREGNVKRFSDDGEPQGTAGMPVLDVIEKQGLCDVLVVVTRYFGGVLLGTGGLVRAYSHSAALAIEAAKPVLMTPATECFLSCDYSSYGTIQVFLNNEECKDITSVFEDDVKINFYVKSDNLSGFENRLTELSNGKIELIKKSEKFLPF